ncbi:MAG: DinB family protein [Verrucomicrobia bacterium]|nr:DinB family protein [Verrucomicrobiota bacterium]
MERRLSLSWQAIELVARLTDDHYTKIDPPQYSSSVGAHMRHVLDHYFCFLEGLDKGRIDYADRARNPRLEHDRSFAVEQLRDTISRVCALASLDARHPLEMRIEGDGVEGHAAWAVSTVGRELDFLLSHTIHHYGMVAIILRLQGVEPGAGFGVAPSTLRHVHESTVCAQ